MGGIAVEVRDKRGVPAARIADSLLLKPPLREASGRIRFNPRAATEIALATVDADLLLTTIAADASCRKQR